jgi:excisionase family DNA binding protein
MTTAELRERLTLTVAETAEVLGCSTDAVYEAIQNDEFPVGVVRIGRRLIVPAKPLRALLGIGDDD